MAYGRKTGGRRKGTPNKTTIAREAEIAASGATPLEVMISNMRFYHQESIDLVNKLLTGGVPPAEPTEDGEPGEVNESLVEQLRTILTLRKLAGEEAARAAPYVHPRIGYDHADGNSDPDFIPLAERLKEYQRRDELKAAGDNVIELKPPDDQ